MDGFLSVVGIGLFWFVIIPLLLCWMGGDHRGNLHRHGDVWHDHEYDGMLSHRHPYGDDRFIYIKKEH